MNDEVIKRYSLAEIVLLFVFMIGLFLSYLFVKARNRIILSDPIPLAGSGLAVRLPKNPGWITPESNWLYESDNSTVLVAQHQIRGIRNAAVRWRYVICSPGGTAREILQRRIAETGAKAGPIKTISGPVPMDYAILSPEGADEAVLYLGVASLDFGRHLELQVFSYQQFDMSYPEALLQTLAKGIVYQPPQELKDGKKLVSDFWEMVASKGLPPAENDEQAFLIKNVNNEPFGYAVFRYSSVGVDDHSRLQIRSHVYTHTLSRSESTFWFDGVQKRFNWTTSLLTRGTASPRKYTVTQKSNGNVTLDTNTGEDKSFSCEGGGMLLPELLLDECAALFLQHPTDKVVVDVISAQGAVVPTLLQKAHIQGSTAPSDHIAYEIKADFLYHPNLFDQLYFDENRRLIRRFEHQPLGGRLWDLSTIEQLKKIFGNNFQPLSGKVAAAK